MYFKNMPERLKSQVNSIFNKNERMSTQVVDDKPVSVFDRSKSVKTTFDSGKLIPIFIDEVLPGDIWEIDVKTILRLGTPQAATMENPIFDINFFSVPNRIIWEEWKTLMGESKTAGFQEEITKVPGINFNGAISYNENDLAAYLGIPINITLTNLDVFVTSLPFKAYIKIWNDFYRDENLQSEIDNTNNNNPNADVNVSDYINSDINLSLQIGKGLATVSRLDDYFSTCLPWPQKGDPVEISTLSLANLLVTGGVVNAPDGSNSQIVVYDDSGNPISPGTNGQNSFLGINTNGTGNIDFGSGKDPTSVNSIVFNADLITGVHQKLKLDDDVTISVKNNTSPIYNVNDLRLALSIQHMRELDARGGTRYIEILLNHFGIQSSDVRLQRAEFIGGFRDIVSIDNIVQSSSSTADSPLGVIGGVSVTSSTTPAKIQFAAEEHGWIIGVITVRSNISYSQGLEKFWTRSEKTDFYDPLLANIGEQPIKKSELFLGKNNGDGTSSNNDVFGYNEPWAEYRWSKNLLTGYLSVNSATSIASLYTYTEKYSSAPTLTGDWITYDPDIIGNTQVLGSNGKSEFIHQFMGDFWFDVSVVRKMPAFGIPGLNKI